MDSILLSTKERLGILEDDTSFDSEIIANINSIFFVLYKMGVGPKKVFSIKDDGDTWKDFISEDCSYYSTLPLYVYARVKKIFDPPASSSHMEALNSIIKEFEWLIYEDEDSKNTIGGEY